MKSDLETAIQWSKRLEGLLEQKFGAVGKGLHGKIGSVQGQLAETTVRKLRFVATVRNKIVHEEAYSQLEDRPRFERTCEEIIRELESVAGLTAGRASQGITGVFARRKFQKGISRWPVDALSPVLSAVGGCAAFAVSMLRGEDLVTSLIFGVIGAAVGWHWYPVLIMALLFAAGYAAFRYLPELYDQFQHARK